MGISLENALPVVIVKKFNCRLIYGFIKKELKSSFQSKV